jgi:hypothetical protein
MSSQLHIRGLETKTITTKDTKEHEEKPIFSNFFSAFGTIPSSTWQNTHQLKKL